LRNNGAHVFSNSYSLMNISFLLTAELIFVYISWIDIFFLICCPGPYFSIYEQINVKQIINQLYPSKPGYLRKILHRLIISENIHLHSLHTNWSAKTWQNRKDNGIWQSNYKRWIRVWHFYREFYWTDIVPFYQKYCCFAYQNIHLLNWWWKRTYFHKAAKWNITGHKKTNDDCCSFCILCCIITVEVLKEDNRCPSVYYFQHERAFE
jgi:hypothetical protein